MHNLFRNCNKGDGELLMYETGGAPWFGKVAAAEGTRVTLAGAEAAGAKAGCRTDHTAMIVGGRGLVPIG